LKSVEIEEGLNQVGWLAVRYHMLRVPAFACSFACCLFLVEAAGTQAAGG
jgi:hypothetical protein